MHIGQLIKEYYLSLPRSCTIEWFAGELNCHRRNIYDIFSRPTVDIELLYRISKVLNHNFFTDIAEDFDKNNTFDHLE